ncbi:LysR substrate-binding domain-containing protein [Sedimentitalea todarodis]|uniref:LysR substrate-binding domain-containing protein n=2 Tax=Sedimentitalea todarodis TaxID=1631240 RepID=A0ABU3VH89_9RHOB|nr:LysR substrate-binding domain-containing protein [Sedimentitalea todarodis]
MKETSISLPPLDYMLAFEATAEAESFVAASKSLNISETAISRKVRLLELHYGVPFFLRGHRSISITPQGAVFLARIKPALDMLRDASRKTIADHRDRPVTLAATNSVAALWLMPRLQKFNQHNKHLKIMLVSSDDDNECLSDNVDLAILRGDGIWPGYDAQMLFGETVFPVCSPEYLEANPTVADPARIHTLDLIEVSSSHREWMNWRTWLESAGFAVKDLHQGSLFNTYPLSVQAAVEGLGIALGWGHLVDPLLQRQKLVRPLGSAKVRTDHGYYLLKSERKKGFDECRVVEELLLGFSAERTRYG